MPPQPTTSIASPSTCGGLRGRHVLARNPSDPWPACRVRKPSPGGLLAQIIKYLAILPSSGIPSKTSWRRHPACRAGTLDGAGEHSSPWFSSHLLARKAIRAGSQGALWARRPRRPPTPADASLSYPVCGRGPCRSPPDIPPHPPENKANCPRDPRPRAPAHAILTSTWNTPPIPLPSPRSNSA